MRSCRVVRCAVLSVCVTCFSSHRLCFGDSTRVKRPRSRFFPRAPRSRSYRGPPPVQAPARAFFFSTGPRSRYAPPPPDIVSPTGEALCKMINRSSHTHTHTDQRTTPSTPHTHDKNNNPNPQTNTPHKHLTTLEGGATTVRATSHARVGGRAEVSVGGRV